MLECTYIVHIVGMVSNGAIFVEKLNELLRYGYTDFAMLNNAEKTRKRSMVVLLGQLIQYYYLSIFDKQE